MDNFNNKPKDKINEYNKRLNSKSQTDIMSVLNMNDSPLLSQLGRSYRTEDNIIHHVNRTSPKAKPAPKLPDESEEKEDKVIPESGDLYEQVRTKIMMKETGKTGPEAYKVFNLNTNHGKRGSGAWGGYQFIWKWHKDPIKKVTGITMPEEFLQDPEAQDKYFKYHYDTLLKPQAEKFLKEFPNTDLSIQQIMDGIHFRGAFGKDNFFAIYRRGDLDAQLEPNNPTLADRLK